MSKGLRQWILIAALLASAAGAAVGTVLNGRIDSIMGITVGQAIVVEQPAVTNLPSTHRTFTSVSDNRTKFSGVAEVYQKESFILEVPIRNNGNQNIVAEMTLTIPSGVGITADAYKMGVIDDVVRTGPNTWKFTVGSNANGRDDFPTVDGVKIEVATSATTPPGFYEITGEIHIVEY